MFCLFGELRSSSLVGDVWSLVRLWSHLERKHFQIMLENSSLNVQFVIHMSCELTGCM